MYSEDRLMYIFKIALLYNQQIQTKYTKLLYLKSMDLRSNTARSDGKIVATFLDLEQTSC